MTYAARVTELRYRDEYANSNKFYRAYVIQDPEAGDYRVHFQWGRIGTRGSSKTELFPNASSASVAAMNKVDQKLAKGYETVIAWCDSTPDNELLHDAGVSSGSVQQSVTVTEAIDMDITRVIRLATGEADDQVAAVLLSKSIEERLEELRTFVAATEARVEYANTFLMSQLS